jgi:murein DD-endopeptidase MepM/ murein hydrolase activator NlpD
LKVTGASGVIGRLRAIFPDREFFMRSQGRVHFIKLSSRVQIMAASATAALLLAWIAGMAVIAFSEYGTTHDRAALQTREARVASAESRVSAYREDLDTVAADLEKRQDFIDKMAETYFGDLPNEGDEGKGSDKDGEAARVAGKISAALPEAGALARIEARQLAFVARLTRLADQRSARAAGALRKLGLSPKTMLASLDDTSAQGGPLYRLSTSHDGSLDPRFRRLGVSLERMSALERGLAGVPQVLPANQDYVTSSFGYRSDPFTGEGAFHAGLDFRGPIGAPVYAAAKGVVTFAGQRQGYGNCIEIDHGNGLTTRYAHMSRLGARVGQKVEPGKIIGAIGSTGRSTGSHLHFEVRIHDRPVNPRPFLEAAAHASEKPRTGQ